jgi:PAS domain S-box-containing protein
VTEGNRHNLEQRLLVLVPTSKDATLTASVLGRAGVACVCCADLVQLCQELEAGAGAVLLPEEAVSPDRNRCLDEWLARQPPWSDLPVLVLSRPGADSAAVGQAMDLLGNVTVLERPTRVTALVSAVRAALRARQRQYQIRAHLAERERSELVLRHSEQRFSRLVSVITDVPWTTDADGAFVTPQEAYARYTGKSWEELRGFGWTTCIHPEDRGELVRVWKNAVARRDTYVARCREWHGPTQEWRHVIARGTPVLNPDGSVREWVGSLTDVEEQYRADQNLRESEERFRMLADNMSQLAWTCDKLGNVTWYNQRWLDYTGLSFDDMKGWNWSKVQHPHHLDRVVARIKRSAETGEPWDDTFPLRGKDGEYRWFLSRAVPIRNEAGEIVRWFGTNTDVTERIRMEEALKDADRRKDEFLAMLAHELRNPLAPIRNSLHILRLSSPHDSAAERVAEMMERQVNHMVRLVDDLMEVSRISRGKIELRKEPIELAAVVRSAVETSRPFIEAGGHQLALAIPPEPITLEGDFVRLTQVVANLLNNAAKYSDAGGQIWVTVRREGNGVALSVRDTGRGIPPDMLPRVFELFMQIDRHSSRAQGGLGIGLTLVKSLVEMHGGSVEALSEGAGRGSEFVVRLPLGAADSAGHAPGKAVNPSAVLAPRRVLVVDDNRDAAQSLGMLLKLLGADVHVVYSGADAMEAIATYRPAVVLLDIGMPGMDGHEVARRIRQQPESQDITLIALTGWGQEEDRHRSQLAGFDYHLIKPADVDALQSLLGSLEGRPADRRYTR